MKIDIKLSDKTIGDILVTAFDGSYGGSWYWCRPFGGNWLTGDDDWTSVTIREDDDNHKIATVDRKVIERGIQRILSGEVGIRSDLHRQVATVLGDDPDIDADAADCIVQAGVFGELVYG